MRYDITKRLTTKGRKVRFLGFSQRMAGEDFIADVYYKLSRYEDLEEELGCPAETLVKAIGKGIWIIPPHSEERIPMFVRHPYLTFDESINKKGEWENKPLFFFMYRFDEYICNSGYYFLEDYGKTWALTKEELGK